MLYRVRNPEPEPPGQHSMTPVWPLYDPVWPQYEPVRASMILIWPQHDPSMTPAWPQYDPSMTQLFHLFKFEKQIINSESFCSWKPWMTSACGIQNISIDLNNSIYLQAVNTALTHLKFCFTEDIINHRRFKVPFIQNITQALMFMRFLQPLWIKSAN